MCGIAGILGLIGESNRQALRRMSTSLRHRGPDGEGFWEGQPDLAGRGPMLAHRRLSILDLSSAASQPMLDPVTSDVLVLNGEIYNYVSLRERFRAEGHEFQSNGDTAVLLRALAVKGTEAISDLRGMFAFAFWDASAARLVLVRDPLGMKPLYIARNPDPQGDWSFMFASELRALLASGLLAQPRLNPRAVASVIWNGFTVAPDTAVSGVESMLPGEMLVLGRDGQQLAREAYWRMPAPTAEGSENTTEDQVQSSLDECIRLHLASDAPLGVFLSGGIDSSAIANLASRISASPLHTFTLTFEEAEHDEGQYSRGIAQAIGSHHQELLLTEERFIAGLDSALDSLDQPSFDGLNSYFMSRAVGEAGFKVALVGSGGDELFGGYRSFRDLPRLQRFMHLARWAPDGSKVAAARLAASLLSRTPGGFPPQTRWSKLPHMVQRSDSLIGLYQLAYALFIPPAQAQLLANPLPSELEDGLPEVMRNRLASEVGGHEVLSAISVLEQRLFLGERLLRDTDAVSMASSIEIRLPLVDHVLLSTVNRLPTRDRYHPAGRKAALRRIGLRGLDPALFDRPKSGFVLPYDRWLRSRLGVQVGQLLCDEAAVQGAGLVPNPVRRLWKAFQEGAPGLYWSRIWSVYALVRWCHRYGVTA